MTSKGVSARRLSEVVVTAVNAAAVLDGLYAHGAPTDRQLRAAERRLVAIVAMLVPVRDRLGTIAGMIDRVTELRDAVSRGDHRMIGSAARGILGAVGEPG